MGRAKVSASATAWSKAPGEGVVQDAAPVLVGHPAAVRIPDSVVADQDVPVDQVGSSIRR
jgi:hypothetical protein